MSLPICVEHESLKAFQVLDFNLWKVTERFEQQFHTGINFRYIEKQNVTHTQWNIVHLTSRATLRRVTRPLRTEHKVTKLSSSQNTMRFCSSEVPEHQTRGTERGWWLQWLWEGVVVIVSLGELLFGKNKTNRALETSAKFSVMRASDCTTKVVIQSETWCLYWNLTMAFQWLLEVKTLSG